MKTKTMKDVVPYAASARHQQGAARAKLCEEIGALWQSVHHTGQQINGLKVAGINGLREIGLRLDVASGREQLLFTANGVEFFQNHLAKLLPKDLTAKAARACVAIAHALPKPLESVEDLRAFPMELKLGLDMMHCLDLRPPKELATKAQRDAWLAWLEKLARDKVFYRKLTEEVPVAQWPPDVQDQALENLKPYEDMAAEIRRARLGLVK